MKVYAIHMGCQYEGGGLAGLHRTKEGAERRVQELIAYEKKLEDERLAYLEKEHGGLREWDKRKEWAWEEDRHRWCNGYEEIFIHETEVKE